MSVDVMPFGTPRDARDAIGDKIDAAEQALARGVDRLDALRSLLDLAHRAASRLDAAIIGFDDIEKSCRGDIETAALRGVLDRIHPDNKERIT